MNAALRLLLPMAVLSFLMGCRHPTLRPAPLPPSSVPAVPAGLLAPSPRLIIGRVVAVDRAQRFAVVELAADAPADAVAAETALIARTMDLRETARLQTSRQLRGRMLGTKIVDGQPSPGDEVVWLAP